MIKTKFLCDEIPKQNMHYTCIACLTSDSVMTSLLEECKYKPKKIKMTKFIDTELESESESELESDTNQSQNQG